jgi:putative Mg2+ transporter-C (MgtC) family protein
MIASPHLLAAGAVPALDGQGWRQVGELGLALALSALIGLEREIRQKNAGLRTHTLVGVGSALFVLVSKYGFTDVLVTGRIILDPSRVAAQIVSGVGFLGAGLIFVRRDSVRGLTTAAGIWVTAAVGAAAGAGLPVLAAETTAAYLIVVAAAFPWVTRHLPRSATAVSALRIRYLDGRGVLRRLLEAATTRGFTVDGISTGMLGHGDPDGGDWDRQPRVEVLLRVHGRTPVNELAAVLSEIDDVESVAVNDANAIDD